jgi:hypothetical protein|tara:strand:- start:2670 stop:4217 length:1548 start_codon:yes stop_codon:yes gene_type:complete
MLERLKEIFKGLDTAYGQTKKTAEVRPNGKQEVRSFTIKQPVTDHLWQSHIDGVEPALGIVPINENNECKWGAIDIDVYNFDHTAFIKKIRKFELPLILCRSKSGGAHVFCFTSEFVPASLMRTKLQAMASILGYAKTEIFPKQNSVKAERGDVGNFLNMPYHGGDRSVRYAFDDVGKALTMEQFSAYYNKHVLTKEQLIHVQLEKNQTEETIFPDGPPCLQTILSNGAIVEGEDVDHAGRNNGLFNIGVYLRKVNPDTWKNKVEEYNIARYINPPLKANDVISVINSIEKKNYDYKCNDKPICGFCQEKLCYTRKYGKEGAAMPEITQIKKLDSDPPLFFVTVDGETLEVEPEILHDPEKFSIVCLTQLNKPLLPIAKLIWRKMISKLLNEMNEPLPAPEDMRIDVQLKEVLVDFVSRAPGKSLSDIKKSKAFIEEGVCYFRWKDFWRALVRTKSWPDKTYPKNKTMRLVQNIFKGKQVFKKIDEKTERIWAVDKIDLDTVIIRKNKAKDAPFQ